MASVSAGMVWVPFGGCVGVRVMDRTGLPICLRRCVKFFFRICRRFASKLRSIRSGQRWPKTNSEKPGKTRGRSRGKHQRQHQNQIQKSGSRVESPQTLKAEAIHHRFWTLLPLLPLLPLLLGKGIQSHNREKHSSPFSTEARQVKLAGFRLCTLPTLCLRSKIVDLRKS